MNGIVSRIRRLLPLALAKKLPREVQVIKISAQESRRLNLKFRPKNSPANVLSFRYGGDYGEILVCPGVIQQEAKTAGHTYKYQMTWMILHGMLHLAGVHHETSKVAAGKAERIEQRILSQIFK